MAADVQDCRFPVMGTTAHVMVTGGDNAALDRARRRLLDLEGRWSRFLPDSELSQLNDSPGVPVVVSAETYLLVTTAIEAWDQTGHRFDPTIETTMTAAGYDRSFELLLTGPGGPPVVDHRPAPGPSGIVLHPYTNAIELPPGVRLDLGGIAKGAAADLVAGELLADVDGCCVNIGGDLRAMGRPPRPEGWQVTLDCPGADRTVPIGLAEGAICTTTKTRRRWSTATGSEHHLRNPASGSSLETGVASVTVIAARATQAEVLTKAMFAAGLPAMLEMAERWAVSGVVVDDRGTVVAMPGLTPFVEAALVPVPI